MYLDRLLKYINTLIAAAIVLALVIVYWYAYRPMPQTSGAIEAFVSRLSVRDNVWHSVCSLIWLPLAFFSGIRLKMVNTATKAFDSAAQGAEDAVQSAVATAGKTVREMCWFEVAETRGKIKDNKVAEWQVTLKVGFKIEE